MLNIDYENKISIFKALSDANRLKIIEILSCGEICACKLLENLNITQPTLSHHMKILCDCNLVTGRKEGLWTHYVLNKNTISDYIDFILDITKEKPKNILKQTNCVCEENGEK